ncbi:MAG: hypothetical protein JO257_18590 [Deltaproteobacteria bacterium]|nr:hypothetical protein [Deltaproteobacteria bacterium]
MSDANNPPPGDVKEPSPPLVGKIKDWLAQNGYPLEMRVTRMFRTAKCKKVVQSEFYETTNEKGEPIWREIDVAAQVARTIKGSHPLKPTEGVQFFCDFFFTCECKNNARADRPWLVFTDIHAAPTNFPLMMGLPMSGLAMQLMFRVTADREFDETTALEFFAPRRVGYGAVQPSFGGGTKPRENYDGAHQAITSVLSAANAKTNVTSGLYKIVRIVLPVVVITAPLYECYLDEHGQIQLESREEMTMFWRNPQVGLPDSIVFIVREPAMPAFIEKAKKGFEGVFSFEDDLFAAFRVQEERREDDAG